MTSATSAFTCRLTLAIGCLTTLISRADEAGAVLKLDAIEVNDSRAGEYVSTASSFATRTDTPLRDIPASVQIVTQQLFVDKGALSPDAVLTNVSGVSRGAMNEGNYGVGDNYYARGLDVKLLRDGFSEGVGRYANYPRSLVDVDRIEVLKGPGSALYGNSYGGAVVNFISREPEFQPSAELRVFAGSFGSRGFALDATGPLGRSDKLAYRFDAGLHDQDGFRHLKEHRIEGVGALRWKLAPNQSLTLRAEYRHIERQPDTVGIPYKNNLGLVPVRRETELYTRYSRGENDFVTTRALWESHPDVDTTFRAQLSFTTRDIHVDRNRGGVNQPTYDVATGTFPALTNPVYYSLTGRSFDMQHDQLDTLTAGLEAVRKFSTSTLRHTVLSGVEFFRTTDETDDDRSTLAAIADLRTMSGPLPGDDRGAVLFTPVFRDRTLRLDTLSAFAQDQIDITDQLKARVAARLDRFALVDAGNYNIAAPLITSTPAPNGQSYVPSAPVFRHERGENVTTKGTVQGGVMWQPTSNTSFYAGAATGTKAQFDTESMRSANVPEASRSYEIGNKTSFLRDRLNVNLAAFETSRRNFPTTLPNGQTATVGEIRTRGLELDVTAAPVTGWNILFSAAVQKPEYRMFNTNDAYTGVLFNARGFQTAGVPKRLASLWSSYTFQSGPLRHFGFGAGFDAKDKVYIDASNHQRVPGYAVLGAAIYYRTSRWSAQLNVQNLTDRTWYPRLANTAALPGDPRTYQVTLTAKF